MRSRVIVGVMRSDREQGEAGPDRLGELLRPVGSSRTLVGTVMRDDEQLGREILAILLETTPSPECQVAAEERDRPIRLVGPGHTHDRTDGVNAAPGGAPTSGAPWATADASKTEG